MAEGIASNVAGTILEPIRDSLYAVISRHYGYMIHCKKNIQDFADEVDNLKNAHARVQTDVDEARANAEDIHDDVSKWLTKVGTSLPTLEQDKNRLVQGKDNLKCLDVCSRYRLGKEGKKKTSDVTKLIEAGGKFEAVRGRQVGHRPLLKCTWHRTESTKYESFESRESVFKDIMEALKDDSNYKIGIYGMAGVGKTRMMKEVAQQAEKDKLFGEIAKIVFTQNPNVKEMQQQLAEDLNLTLDKETEDARKELLLKRLRKDKKKNDETKIDKKILIMVDDVWDGKIKLEKIGIPDADDNTKNCRIIMTSRIKDAFVGMGVKKPFEIGVLSEFEAFDLFKKTVGESIELPQLRSIAGKVCTKCGGLPLAIVTIGAALANATNGAALKEARKVWDDTLYQLENFRGCNIAGVDGKLYLCIELSYKYLKQNNSRQKELQPCFLLCCLFPEDAEISIDNLARYGVATRSLEGLNRESMEKARNRTCVLVDTLKKCNLLLNGRNQNFVKMHDVIRDVAISIASEEKDAMFLVKAGVRKWPDENEYKQCKAISLKFNNNYVFPNDLECSELHTLMMEFRKLSAKVPSSFFKGMEKLEVLQLRTMKISELPSSLKNLRMLCLYNCKLVKVAFLKEFKKLEILCIEDYDLKELTPEITQLTGLWLLDLRGCCRLQIISSGVISSLSQLEELYIPVEFDQWEVKDNASLNELNSLKDLINLQVYVPDVMLLLPLVEPLFKLLNRFQISIGSKLSHLEQVSSAARILKVVGFPLKKELNILMECAEVLYLEDLRENVPKGLCRSVSFRELSLLKVEKCKSMIYLFSSATARSLSQLQELSISNCEIMEEIVRDDQEVMDGVIIFDHLKKIELNYLPKLRSFYANMKKSTTRDCNTSTLVQALFNDKVAFPALEELEIEHLDSLATIWECQSQSQVSFQSLQKLEKLEVCWCDSVEEIVAVERGQFGEEDVVHDEIIVFPQLKHLKLVILKNLKSFTHKSKEEEETVDQRVEVLFNHKVEFPALEELEIAWLESLAAIWEGQSQSLLVKEAQVSFQSLRVMEVRGCNKLVNVIASNVLPSLQKLEKLGVEMCDSVEEIVAIERRQLEEEDVVHDEIIVFPQLKYLKLEELPNLKSFTHGSKEEEETVDQRVEVLFNHKVAFPALEKLEIRDLESLATIWECQSQSQVSFQSLRFMTVWGCEKLVNVIASNVLPSLPKLEKLEVRRCDSVKEIVAVERGQLGEEDVVHDEIIVFPQLKYLKFFSLKNLKSFTHGSKKKEETVDQRVEALFNHKVAFPALEELNIWELESLAAIWEGQSQSLLVKEAQVSFQSLRFMTVKECKKLVNVIASNMLPSFQKLEKLKVSRCDSVKEIVAVERGQLGEEDVVHDEIIVLPQLKDLNIRCLPRVKTLFNNKVAFPALEELEIWDLNNLAAIWEGQSQSLLVKEAQVSFQRLKFMKVWRCHGLVNVIASNVLPSLQKLEKLEVVICNSVEEIVAVEREQLGEEDVMHDEIIVFPQLKYLKLLCLPNFKSFTHGSKKSKETVDQIIPRVEALFNYKVSFPALEKLKIKELQSLTVIWDNQLFLDSRARDSFGQLRVVIVEECEKLVNVISPNASSQGLMVFHSLKYLLLIKCNSLRYLFSLSIARGLTQLRQLVILGCSVMEEIVRSEGQGEEDDMEEIVFTQLNGLGLDGLPNLTCFCGTNNAFKFPSLEEVVLGKCPQLQTFTTGCLSTPDKLTIDYEGRECNDVIDLNNYVQQFVRRGKGLAVDESPGDDKFADFVYFDGDDERMMQRMKEWMMIIRMIKQQFSSLRHCGEDGEDGEDGGSDLIR